MATVARETRPTLPLAGVGGFMEVEWASEAGGSGQVRKPTEGDKLEVEEWRIDHDLIEVTLPLSGGKGALTPMRVADKFDFTAIVAMNILPAKTTGPANTFLKQPFLDGMLEGEPHDNAMFYVALRFQCGEPSFWHPGRAGSIVGPDQPNPGIFYFCQRALLTRTQTITPIKDKKVIRAIVTGKGAAPLERHVGTTQIALGSLGFDVPKKGNG
jgi:hypothetical protein